MISVREHASQYHISPCQLSLRQVRNEPHTSPALVQEASWAAPLAFRKSLQEHPGALDGHGVFLSVASIAAEDVE